MPRIRADDEDVAFTANGLALGANLLDGCSDTHDGFVVGGRTRFNAA